MLALQIGANIIKSHRKYLKTLNKTKDYPQNALYQSWRYDD
jgi:hypothetical protein